MQPVVVSSTTVSPISAVLLGAVVGGAGSIGRNLHEVQEGRMTLSQAMSRGLVHGAIAGAATTAATLLTANVSDNGALHLATLAITTAGLSYLVATGLDKTLPCAPES